MALKMVTSQQHAQVQAQQVAVAVAYVTARAERDALAAELAASQKREHQLAGLNHQLASRLLVAEARLQAKDAHLEQARAEAVAGLEA